jgi:hypothetical protein
MATAVVKGVRACDALNLAKGVTAAVLLTASLFLPRPVLADNLRASLYLSLHLSYIAWWFLHQLLVPGWAEKVFRQELGQAQLSLLLGVVGAGYAAPGVLACLNPTPLRPLAAALFVLLFCVGCFLNIAADCYKAGAKAQGALKVTTGPFAVLSFPHWTGDWLRYASLACVSGYKLSFLVPAFVVVQNCACKRCDALHRRLHRKHSSLTLDFSRLRRHDVR